MVIIGIAPRVEAGFVPSEIIALKEVDRKADMEKVQRFLEMKIVRDRLEKLGFTHEEIDSRLSQMSDQQLHQVAQQIDELKVGADGIGAVIGLLVIVILVILILQLTGHRVVVTR
jgi:DNA-binding transcriptional MerR regulator